MMINILIVCAICACIFSILSLALGLVALLKVMAMERSTHSIQFEPVKNWATSSEEIEEINTEFKEDNEPEIEMFKGI